MMNRLLKVLLILHLFVGAGAVFGGLAAVLNPEAPMGLEPSSIEGFPFDSFMVPGLFLFTVIGIGNIAGAVLIRFRLKHQAYISGFLSLVLVFWIIIQCILLRGVHFLHVIYFLLGLFGGGVSLVLLLREDIFPSALIKKVMQRLGGDL